MSVKVFGIRQRLELHLWWEHGVEGTRVPIRDPLAARALLSRIAAAGDLSTLRRLVAGEVALSRVDDAALLDLLAGWLTSGRLRVAATPREQLTSWGDVGEEVPVEAPVERPAPSEPPEEEPDVDQLDQAQALIEAAKKGIPLCEECERDAQEAA